MRATTYRQFWVLNTYASGTVGVMEVAGDADTLINLREALSLSGLGMRVVDRLEARLIRATLRGEPLHPNDQETERAILNALNTNPPEFAQWPGLRAPGPVTAGGGVDLVALGFHGAEESTEARQPDAPGKKDVAGTPGFGLGQCESPALDCGNHPFAVDGARRHHPAFYWIESAGWLVALGVLIACSGALFGFGLRLGLRLLGA